VRGGHMNWVQIEMGGSNLGLESICTGKKINNGCNRLDWYDLWRIKRLV